MPRQRQAAGEAFGKAHAARGCRGPQGSIFCHVTSQERRRKREELLQLLREKQGELDRLQAEEESLQRVRQEQELMLAKLADGGG